MTLHFSERDAQFHANQNLAIDGNGDNKLDGEARLILEGAEIGWVKDILSDNPNRLIQGGKSTLGQAGVDSSIDLSQAVIEGNVLSAPVELLNYSPHQWLRVVQQNPLELGKIGMRSEDHLPMGKSEIIDLINQGFIQLPKYYKKNLISETGEVPLKLVPGVEWILPPELTDDEILSMIKNGRIALRKLQAIAPRNRVSQIVSPGETFVGGIPVSMVGVTAMVGDAVGGVLKHLEARRLDGDRTTGTFGYKDPTKLIHVELVNQGDQAVTKSEVRVPLTFHENGSPSPVQKVFKGWTPDKQKRIHREGIALSDVLDFSDESFCRMFEIIRGKTHSVVIRKGGMVSVPESQTYDWQKKAEVKALNDNDLCRTSNGFKKLQQGLESTHEQGAILVTRALGSISHLEQLYEQGVRHIFFERMNMDRISHEEPEQGSARGDLYLDSGKHLKMLDLEYKGMKFYWRPKLANGDTMAMREFYRGAFILPDQENKDLVDRVSFKGASIAMFGSSVDESEENPLEDEISDFVGRLGVTFNGHLGIIHGNGPSVMAMADKAARKHGLLSIGMGMDFEQVGEIPNYTPQQLVFFKDNEIEYRQTCFERLQTVPVFNLGGKGTYYELILSFLKTGLKSSLPVPIVLVDPTGTSFWQPTIGQVENMAQNQIGSYSFARPLTQKWTTEIFKPVKNYDEAAGVIESFYKDPEAFWQQIGISEAELMVAFKNQLDLYKSVNQGIPDFLFPAFKKRGLI